MENTKHNRLFVVSNMYPSKKYPSYGVFVRNFIESFKFQEKISIKKTAVLTKNNNPLIKILTYCFFYFEIIFKGVFSKYDTIYVHFISHSAIPVYIVKLIRPQKKLILNTHGSDIISKGVLFPIFLIFMRRLFDRANLIIVPSPSFKKEIQRLTSANNLHKIKHSYSGGVDTVKFSPRNFKINNCESFTIGFVSRITKEKGWQTLVEAIGLLDQSGKIKNISVIIVGNGNELDFAKNKVFQLGLIDKITFLGDLSQDELPDLYKNFDIMVFPSQRESLGLVGIEALACGIPVIGSRIDGIKEYVRDGDNGFLFQTGNALDLYEKILKYYSLNELEKRNLSMIARETAIKFDKTIVLNDLISKIEQI